MLLLLLFLLLLFIIIVIVIVIVIVIICMCYCYYYGKYYSWDFFMGRTMVITTINLDVVPGHLWRNDPTWQPARWPKAKP